MPTDAVLRWTHPEDAPDDVQVHELPVHVQNLAHLRKLCSDLSVGPLPIEAHVLSTPPKNGRGQQVTTVCLSGSPELVNKSRETILNEIPISMVCLIFRRVLTVYCCCRMLTPLAALHHNRY